MGEIDASKDNCSVKIESLEWHQCCYWLKLADIGQDFFHIQEKKNGTYFLWDKYAE